jgi:hypothetical protein
MTELARGTMGATGATAMSSVVYIPSDFPSTPQYGEMVRPLSPRLLRFSLRPVNARLEFLQK